METKGDSIVGNTLESNIEVKQKDQTDDVKNDSVTDHDPTDVLRNDSVIDDDPTFVDTQDSVTDENETDVIKKVSITEEADHADVLKQNSVTEEDETQKNDSVISVDMRQEEEDILEKTKSIPPLYIPRPDIIQSEYSEVKLKERKKDMAKGSYEYDETKTDKNYLCILFPFSSCINSECDIEKCIKQYVFRVGNSGVGAWKVGTVSSDVIIENIVY